MVKNAYLPHFTPLFGQNGPNRQYFENLVIKNRVQVSQFGPKNYYRCKKRFKKVLLFHKNVKICIFEIFTNLRNFLGILSYDRFMAILAHCVKGIFLNFFSISVALYKKYRVFSYTTYRKSEFYEKVEDVLRIQE